MVVWPIFLPMSVIKSVTVGLRPSEGRSGFLGKSCKRVRLTKKTRVSGSERPIPGGFVRDAGIHENPDIGRSVVRRLSGCSSPGGRLDQTGIS